MTAAEGRKFLPNVWNLFFKPFTEANFFIEPWENREFRDCADFRLGSEKGQLDEVFFFVTDEELIRFLNETLGELYLFGAYNQVSVCQMRAGGTVALAEEHPEAEQIRKRLRDAIEHRAGEAPRTRRLNKKEAEERYAILENGLLFRFLISSYAYSVYERG
jgi:hypothetical protein